MTSCIPALERALGETATPEQLESLYAEIRDKVMARAAILMGNGTERAAAFAQSADFFGQQQVMASYIAKRNAAKNLAIRVQRTAWVQANFGSNFARGIEAMMVGIQSAKGSTRASAAAEQEMLKETYLSRFGEAMRQAGVWEAHVAGDKQFDHDTFAAWHAIGDPNQAHLHSQLPPLAVRAATIIAEHTEGARLDANDAGAWIAKLDNWAGRQTHNAELIFNATKPVWTADVTEWFDLPRMMAARGTVNQSQMLSEMFKTLAADVHETKSNPLVGNVGTHNIAKMLSESRTVHFKDAESAWQYNQKYGGNYSPALVWGNQVGNTQSLANSITMQLNGMAEATGLMRIMGPNPQALLDTMIADSRAVLRDQMGTAAAGDAKNNLKMLNAREPELKNFMAAIDGSTNQVGSAMKARIGQTARKLTQLADLGGMLLSQFSDVAQHMSASNYRGKGYMSGLHESIVGLFGTDLIDPANRSLAASLSVTLDNMMGEVARAGSFDVPGTGSKMMQWFYKWNGANWWNAHMRFAAAAGLSNDLASDVEKSFAQLNPNLQRLLGQYNITGAEWDTIRAAPLHNLSGNNYVLPEHITDRKVSVQLRTLITDQTTYGQLDPSVKTRAMMLSVLGSGQAGTTGGEIARSVLLFKSFNVAFMEKTIGRELFGRGFEYDNASSTNVLRALAGGRNGEQAALAKLILITTAFGYASMVAKDIARGVMPQDPGELSTKQRIELVIRAAQQGGGAGIYGDFLLQQANRMGGGIADTALGPVLGRVTGAAQWIVKMRDELAKGEVKPDIGAGLYKGLVRSIPGNNLFWAKWAMDYLVNYRVQEALNPGHLQRVENDMRKNSNQHFIFRPQTGPVLQ